MSLLDNTLDCRAATSGFIRRDNFSPEMSSVSAEGLGLVLVFVIGEKTRCRFCVRRFGVPYR
jgi:hypothetical protein